MDPRLELTEHVQLELLHMQMYPPSWILRFPDSKAVCSIYNWSGFPLGLENLGKWEGIFQSGKSQGILNRLEKSGKITQNTGKLREFEINIIDILSAIKMNCVLFVKMGQVFILKKLSIKKILENAKKYWKSQGILSVRKSGNPVGSLRIKILKQGEYYVE